MPGIGRDSIKPSRQNVVTREDGVASLEATCKFENRLSFTAGWRKFWDRGYRGRGHAA
jgi:hypothetical protein